MGFFDNGKPGIDIRFFIKSGVPLDIDDRPQGFVFHKPREKGGVRKQFTPE